jgi:energy-coupling factor transporter ATP-binding protein EcfA2
VKDFMPLDIALGDDLSTGKTVSWTPGEESNGFFLIMGGSGSGKTEALKVIGRGLIEHAMPVLVLDFHGDVFFPGQESYLMSSGTDSWLGINPMALDGHDDRRVGLYDRIEALVEMIAKAAPRFGTRQRSILSKAMKEAYDRAGFNDSFGGSRRGCVPTFGTVLNILEQWARDPKQKDERSRIRSCIDVVGTVFGHPVFQRRQNLSVEDILRGSTRLDLTKLPEEMKFLVSETVLRMVFNVVCLLGPIPRQPADDSERFRLFILIDEAKLMSLHKDPDAPDFILNRLFTESRKFGIGMVVASQSSDHFGADLKANAAKKLILKSNDMAQARRSASLVKGGGADELLALQGSGEGILGGGKGGGQKIQVECLAVSEPLSEAG